MDGLKYRVKNAVELVKIAVTAREKVTKSFT